MAERDDNRDSFPDLFDDDFMGDHHDLPDEFDDMDNDVSSLSDDVQTPEQSPLPDDIDFSVLNDDSGHDQMTPLSRDKKKITASSSGQDMVRDVDLGFGELLDDDDMTDDEKDLEHILEMQRIDNKRYVSRHRFQPGSVMLVNDAVEEEIRTDDGRDPGDNTAMKVVAGIGVLLVLLMVASFVFQFFYNPEPDTNDIRTHGQTTLGPGDIIAQQTDNAQDDTQGAGSDVSDGDVRVPEGGSLVRYTIVTEGDINSVSTAYISAAGSQDSETGIEAFPWSTSVGMRDSINPQIAVNSSGYGTVTCTITSDGEKVSEKTSSGENPSVECAL